MALVFNPFTSNFDEVIDLSTSVGSSPNSNGSTVVQSGTSVALTLQPADGTNPGLLTALTQNIGGSKTFLDAVSLDANQINNLADPTLATDAATKGYVDAAINGLFWLPPVQAISFTNVPLTGATPLVIDGYTALNGDRVALAAQTISSQQGIYTVSIVTGVYTLNLVSPAVAVGDAFLSLNGTLHANDSFVTSSISPAVFTQFAGPNTLMVGTIDSQTPSPNALVVLGNTIYAQTASSSQNGMLSAADWSTFNSKQPAGSYITALTGDGTASGPGSAAFTLATVNSNIGTFASVTVNGKGLVTAAANLSGDATTSSSTITLATVNSNVGSFTNANITVNAKGLITAAANGTAGTVTSVSVATANGFAGTSSGGATPALTLTTTITGILQGNGTAISAATTTGTGNVVLSDSPTLTGTIVAAALTLSTPLGVASGGTGASSLTAHALLIGNGTSPITQLAAVATGSLLASAGTTADPAYSTTPTLGVNGTTAGTLSLATSTGGGASVTIQNTSATSAYNFNLPSTAGTAGLFLVSQGGGSTAMSWGTAGNISVVSKTTTYAIASTDGLILCSGSAFTVTLPTASGTAGETHRIMKTDSSLTNIITIATTSSQTIGFYGTSVTINTQGEAWTVVSDGSNWQVVVHDIPSNNVSWTPTGSSSTNTTYSGQYMRMGKNVLLTFRVAWSGSPGTVNPITLNMPTGMTIDTTALNFTDSGAPLFFKGSYNHAGTFNLLEGVYNSTSVITFKTTGSTTGAFNNTTPSTIANGDFLDGTMMIPVSGWLG